MVSGVIISCNNRHGEILLISDSQYFELGYILLSRFHKSVKLWFSTWNWVVFHQRELLMMQDRLNYLSWWRWFYGLPVFKDSKLLIERDWSPFAFNRHPVFIWCLCLNVWSFFTWGCECSLNLLRLKYLNNLWMTIFSNLRLPHLRHGCLTLL